MKYAILHTSVGDITLELDDHKAPITVENFLTYVREGQYDKTIFHRVIDGFMIQGGGFAAGMRLLPTRPPISNEAYNGLKNVPYSIAMARTNEPHSATAQFFINVTNNNFLDHTERTQQGWGYTVFGRVIAGDDTVDAIRREKTGLRNGHQDVPVQDVVIIRAAEYDLDTHSEIFPVKAGVPAEKIEEYRVVPILTEQTKRFMLHGLQRTVELSDGSSVITAPLVANTVVNLLAIGESKPLLETGLLDNTDSLDSKGGVSTLYLKFPGGENDIIAFNPEAVLTESERQLSVLNESLMFIRPDTRSIHGPIPSLAGFQHLGLTIVLNVPFFFSANTQTADSELKAGAITLNSIIFPDDFKLSRSNVEQSILDTISAVKIVGYDVKIDRINTNRRPRN